MAKSSRASTRKANRSALRAKVFGPVEDARTARLADKLTELATKSLKPDINMENDRDAKTSADSRPSPEKPASEAMDVETPNKPGRPNRVMKSTEIRDKREKRKTLRKNRSSTTFKAKSTRSKKR